MGAHEIDAKSSPLTTNNTSEKCCLWGGSRCKCVSALVLIFIFCYTAWTFAGSQTTISGEDTESWRLDVECFRQNEIIIDTHGLETEQATPYNKHNHSEPATNGKAQPNNVTVVHGTGPEKDDTRPDIVEIQTIFSILNSSFADLNLGENNQIPTVQFISISTDISPLLDMIGSSVSMIEGDIKGNAQKLIKVHDENPSKCKTLQEMLIFDITSGRQNEDGRSVVSLMWYKRAYEFIGRFIQYTIEGVEPVKAAGTAYDQVLSKHHNMFVKAAFNLYKNMLPSRKNFFKSLVINKEDLHRPDYEVKVTADATHYLKSMRHVFEILWDFYTKNNLEN